MVVLIVLLVCEVLFALCAGQYSISIPDVVGIITSKFFAVEQTWSPTASNIVFSVRLPRIVGSLLVGAALALSGASYQGVFKNPLVSPDLLGVSSGACVGASLAILWGFASFGIQAMAFIFGIATVAMTVTIPKFLRNNSMTMMVLSGVIVSGIMVSLLGMIKYLADPETQLASITYWQLGSLTKVTPGDLAAIFPVILVSAGVILAIRWRVNILSLGENEARSLGVNTGLIRDIIILCATLLTACSVCICGTIGWVGLVIPHVSRMLSGPDNVESMPVCVVLGAIFMLLIDTAARLLTTLELPLGILTGLIGAPFFMFILLKQRSNLT